jgi:hypothetical protein
VIQEAKPEPVKEEPAKFSTSFA